MSIGRNEGGVRELFKNLRHSSKNRLSAGMLGLAFGVVVFPISIWSQEETISVRSDLVVVPVTVLNRDGRNVTNLSKRDFKLFEDGTEQEIEFFETVDSPITVLILLDRSGSMSSRLKDLADAANSFVEQLRPDDQFIAATFADNVHVIVKKTTIREFRKVVDIRRRFGDHTTMVYEAVDYGIKKLKKVGGRKAIILFTDGVSGETPFVSAAKTLRDAVEQEATIYTIRFDTSGRFSGLSEKKFQNTLELYKNAEEYMRRLSEITGGRSFRIEDLMDLERTFSEVAAELSRQYTLGYYPNHAGIDGERRKIKVSVNIPNAAVRSRTEVLYRKAKN